MVYLCPLSSSSLFSTIYLQYSFQKAEFVMFPPVKCLLVVFHSSQERKIQSIILNLSLEGLHGMATPTSLLQFVLLPTPWVLLVLKNVSDGPFSFLHQDLYICCHIIFPTLPLTQAFTCLTSPLWSTQISFPQGSISGL